MNSDENDCVAYSLCCICGQPPVTPHLDGEHPICERCEQARKDAAEQFKRKLQEMRATKSIPGYTGPRATRNPS